MLTDATDFLRVVNFALALISLIHLLKFYTKHRFKLKKGERDQWLIWVIVSFSVMGFAFTGIINHVPVTFRTLMITLIAVTMFYGIYVSKLWPYDKDDSDENL